MPSHLNLRPSGSKPSKKRCWIQVSGTVHTISDNGNISTEHVRIGPRGVAKSEAQAALERMGNNSLAEFNA